MIFITGDTHGRYDIRKLNSKSFSMGKQLTKEDYVIIAGDFGFIWFGNREDDYWIKWFNKKPFTTLFVDGNHENFELLNSYPVEKWNGGKVHRISNSVIHLMRGQVYTINENNEILVTKRHQDKTFPLLWEITGGSVIKGESLLEGAKRELEEETGIKVNEEDLHLIYKTTSGDSLYRSFITFIKTNEQIITLQDEETIDYKWIPIYAFEQFILSPKFVYTIKNT
jgi:8-oxo-dGTP pyrophosphatase MutT (NUDIX family)